MSSISGQRQPLLSVILVHTSSEVELKSDVLRISGRLQANNIQHEIIVVSSVSNTEDPIVSAKLESSTLLRNVDIVHTRGFVTIDQLTIMGLELSIGDAAVIFDSSYDSVELLATLFDLVESGTEVVYVVNQNLHHPQFFYRLLNNLYEYVYLKFTGISISKDAPRFRILHREVINYILKRSNPVAVYRWLPTISGFSSQKIYASEFKDITTKKSLRDSIEYGIQLLVVTTQSPLRLANSFFVIVTFLNVLACLFYSIVSSSNQINMKAWIVWFPISVILFLFSVAFSILSEYLLTFLRNIADEPQVLSRKRNGYSAFKEQLNILESGNAETNE